MTAQESSAPVGRRVHWLELFFDLVMVVYIGQIARFMHGTPSVVDAVVFFVLLAAAWWAWVNASITMNLFGVRVTPMIWIAVVLAMAAIGLMAASVPQALGDRSAAFAIGNALIRMIWMLPWFVKHKSIGTPWWRPVLYNVVPAALWIISIAVPTPWRFILWIIAIAIEVLLLTGIGRRSDWLRAHLDLDHLIERVVLVVVIVFGESVLSIISEFSATWSLLAGITAALAFATIALLAWVFFGNALEAVDRGLHRLQRSGSVAGLRDAVMYLPYVIVAGITLSAAGLGTAVADGGEPLPLASALCIAGGLSLFFAASMAESLRYRAPWRDVALWGPLGVVLPWLVVPVALIAPAAVVVATALGVIAALTTLTAVNTQRVRARSV